MFRSRLIPTAVNLSLIVVMMIQPGMALVFANDCGAKCASGFSCEGCGCCKVGSHEALYGCCAGGGNVAGATSCCMGETEPDDAWDGSRKVPDAGVALERKVVVISTIAPVTDDGCETEANATLAGEAVSTACRCGIESPPLSESPPSRPTDSTRQSVTIRHSDLVDLFGGSMFLRPRHRDAGDVSRAPHFFQMQFCIWRL